MKKLLSVLLALLLVLTLLPWQSHAVRNSVKAIQLVQKSEEFAAVDLPGAQESRLWFGAYQQSSRGRDAQSDPVKWRVLENAEGKLFLLADQNLDARVYHNEDDTVFWRDSEIRAWLNNGTEGFLKQAFTEAEAAALAEVSAVDPAHSSVRSEAEADRVFLLSAAEAAMEAYGFSDDVSRIAHNTSYASAQGSDGSWWLSSAGAANHAAAFVRTDGSISESGQNVTTASGGVRPAVKAELSSVLFLSAVDDSRTFGRRGVGALQKVEDYTGSEWKLTLLDESRDFSVTESEISGVSGQPIELNYTGATPCSDDAPNEFVSAMIVNNSGTPLFYGRLSQPDSSEGTLQITLPSAADLPAGSYWLLVFSEQYNGEKQTNLASAFSFVNLTVSEKLCTVRFLNEDGTMLQTIEVPSGQVPVYPGDPPVKASTEQYVYTFAGWSPELGPVTDDMTYRATYTETLRQYTIQFVNENGEILQQESLPYGQVPAYEGPTPTLPNTAQYTYTFFDWSPAITPVERDATYTANYSKTVNEYTVTFVDEDGNELQRSNVLYGDMPRFNGETPTKDPTVEFAYIFAGWDPQITEVIGNASYTATYNRVPREYTIRFINYDYQELQASPVAYGEMPEYIGETPTRPSTAEYSYTFSGWDPEIAAVTNEATYLAVFTAVENVTYTVTQGAGGSWIKGSSGNYQLTLKRSPDNAACFKHYTETWIDGKPVAVAVNGESNLLIIDGGIMNALGIGPHTVTVKFDDGEAQTTLTVKANSSSAGGSGGSPHTGGLKGTDLWIGLMILAGLSLGTLAVIKLKRQRSGSFTAAVR